MNKKTNEAWVWDLSPLYNGPDDPCFDQDLAEAKKRAHSFRRDFRGRISGESLTADVLSASLHAYEDLQKFTLKPYLYAQLLFLADSTPVTHKALLAKIREGWTEIIEKILFYELELLHIDEEYLAKFFKDPEVGKFSHYLSRLRKTAPYILSEEVEKVLKRKDLTGKEAFAQLFEELTASFRFRFRMPDTEAEAEVTGEELLGLLHHPDRDVRETAFSTFLAKYAENSVVLSACFNNLLLDHFKEVDLRGYPGIMTPHPPGQ